MPFVLQEEHAQNVTQAQGYVEMVLQHIIGDITADAVNQATDELGHFAVKDKVHMHDLHATILNQLGLDHEKLTFRHAGRDYRLTDVQGRVVRELVS